MSYQDETTTEQYKAKISRGLALGLMAHSGNFGTREVEEERSDGSEVILGYTVRSRLPNLQNKRPHLKTRACQGLARYTENREP